MRQLIVWVCLAAPAGAQIPGTAGPAILSRSGTLGYNGGERLGLIGIRPFLALNGTYDSGYGSVAVDPQGTADVRDFYGFSAAAGLSGFHNWRHTLLGVHYVLMGRHYPRFQKFDGIDQILSLGVSHQATRTLAIAVNGVGGSFVRGAGFALPNAYVDPYFSAVPTTEIFDARVYFASAGVDVTYTKTPRLSFNFGGTAAVVRRRGSLGALNSVGARTDVTYRVGKRSSIGVGYFFQHYDFQQQFGASDVHAEMLAYKTALGRRWSFDASAGIFRVESQFARRVQLDPAIAAILGQSTGVEAFHGVNYGFLGRASLTRSFRRSSVGLSYTQDVAPGNGIYLSSRRQSGLANYGYSGFRKLSLSAFAGYTSYSALTQSLRKFEAWHAGSGFGYPILRTIHVNGSIAYYHYIAGNAFYKRDTYHATLGLAWSPSTIPVSIW